MGKEKRKYIRIKPAKPVNLKFRIVPNKKRKRTLKKGKAFSRNISGGGMFIKLPFMKAQLMTGLFSGANKVALELKIPGYNSRIKILGKAVWLDNKIDTKRKQCGMGIEFEEISEEDRERILQYMLHLILQ